MLIVGAIVVRCGHPCPLLCLLINYTSPLFLIERKAHLAQIFLASKTTSIEDFIVISTKLNLVGPLDGINKVTLALVLLECMDLRAVKHWYICCSYLV